MYGIFIRESSCNFGLPTCECDSEYRDRDWVWVRVVWVWVRVSPWFDGVSTADPQNNENQLIYECQKACFYMSMCSMVPRSCWSQAEMHSRSLMRQSLGGGHCDFDVRPRVETRCCYVPNGMEMQGIPDIVTYGVGALTSNGRSQIMYVAPRNLRGSPPLNHKSK